MKKLFSILVLLISLGAAFPAAAQFRYGPTVGLDLTTLKFKQTLFDIDKSVGEVVGIQGEMMFPGIGFGIDIAALYTQRGATLNLGQRKVWASEGYGRERSYLHYLEIPVNLRFKWTRMSGLEDYVAPYVFGGPSFSFLMGHNRIKALEYAGGDLGVQCGIGFEILRHWQVQGSYTWGMTYSLKTVKLEELSARNRTWTVRVTYLF
ncbi:MAG: porin family protein [Clostridiales bacterium]|nr:porin family protein [Clostridiales bacterium]